MRSNLSLAAVGAGIGAGVMFLLDPQMGRRRRALLRDKSFSWTRQAACAIDKTSRDLKNRTQGTIVSIRSGHPMRGGFAILNSNWPPAIRFLAGSTGGAMSAVGLKKGGTLGTVLSSIGMCAAAFAITNFSFRDAIRRAYSETQTDMDQQAENRGIA
jgi:hypothetical protein